MRESNYTLQNSVILSNVNWIYSLLSALGLLTVRQHRGSFVTCSRSNRCCYSLKYRAGTGLQPSCCVGMQGHCRSEPGDFLKSTLHFKREEGKYPERQNVSQVQWGQQLLNLIIYTFHLNIYLPFMPGKWNTLVSNSVFCSLFLFCSVCLSSPT